MFFYNLNKEILNQFPIILDNQLDNREVTKDLYETYAISIYDHWVKEGESDGKLFSFYDTINNDNLLEEYLKIESNYLLFFKKLFKLSAIYIAKENNQGTICKFKKINSENIYLKLCIRNLRESQFMKICLPDLNMILCGSYDLTQIVYFKDREKIKEIRHILNDFKLYLLNR